MDKFKAIMKYILGALALVFGFFLIKKSSDSNTIENEATRIEAKEEILKPQQEHIDKEIEKKKQEIKDLKEKPVKDLSDQELVDYLNKNL